jgi:hypothetical protein
VSAEPDRFSSKLVTESTVLQLPIIPNLPDFPRPLHPTKVPRVAVHSASCQQRHCPNRCFRQRPRRSSHAGMGNTEEGYRCLGRRQASPSTTYTWSTKCRCCRSRSWSWSTTKQTVERSRCRKPAIECRNVRIDNYGKHDLCDDIARVTRTSKGRLTSSLDSLRRLSITSYSGTIQLLFAGSIVHTPAGSTTNLPL